MDELILKACDILDQLGKEKLSDQIFQKFAKKYNAPRGKMKSRWSTRYKKSIDCNNPKGFSQKNYCKRKKRGGQYKSDK
jgi:hypothetical protein